MVVDDAAELARDPFCDQRIVERQIECERVRTVLSERQVFVLFGADLHVRRLEDDGRPVDGELVATFFVERAPNFAAVDLRQQLLDEWELRTEAGSQHAEVRHNAIREQPFERAHHVKVLDVQLALDLLHDLRT